MTVLLTWILANPELATLALGGLLSLASGAAELAGWTKLSKILGTVTLDAGRLTRYGKLLLEARKAINGK